VLEQNFLALKLPSSHFDGVFANAVLFHVPTQELPRILRELHATLKPGGVLFSSNPRGDGQEGWNGDRYGAFHDWQTWRDFVGAAGFVELSHFYRPTALPRDPQPWLASVAQTDVLTTCLRPASGDCRPAASPDPRRFSAPIASGHSESSVQSIEGRVGIWPPCR
jgi:SAM-dependent methyltransferase